MQTTRRKVIPRRFNSSYAPRPLEDFPSPINVEPQQDVESDSQDSEAREVVARNSLRAKLETGHERDEADLVTVSIGTAQYLLP
ncbi:hypothetical protein QFC20_005697 [Naganishia adeliensis]|uniref:Uncharacterized protein n=1 Tax=Naganishia adeliensis TaxID=92952 RepID=A0ACC2VK73_9TREE|nr:hypothetical protein QFC20_005697 [Naganishia adeliensis]